MTVELASAAALFLGAHVGLVLFVVARRLLGNMWGF